MIDKMSKTQFILVAIALVALGWANAAIRAENDLVGQISTNVGLFSLIIFLVIQIAKEYLKNGRR